MGYDVRNLNEYSIVTESQLSSLLSNINLDLILSVIDDIINQRPTDHNFNYTIDNVPAALENNFKQLLTDYGFESDLINSVRTEAYMNIINKVCTRHGLTFNAEQVQDIYSAAYYIYDFLISNFNNYLVKFFVNFINREKNNLYEQLNLLEMKKNKDSSTLYNKKVYKNNKLAIISSNLEYVIGAISALDISFKDILDTVYEDKNIVNLLSTALSPVYDFFKLMYVPLFNSIIMPIIFTNIRLGLAQLSDISLIENDDTVEIIK